MHGQEDAINARQAYTTADKAYDIWQDYCYDQADV